MNAAPTVLGRRVITLNAIIRVMQTEGSRWVAEGDDESSLHTPGAVEAFRQSVASALPEAALTWGVSWQAMFSDDANYRRIRAQLRQYHQRYGDDVTFAAGGGFSNVFASREQVNEDRRLVGLRYPELGA